MERVRNLWEQVRANSRTLDSCAAHEFSIDLNPDQKIGKRWQCKNCGGVVDTTGKYWYDKGKQHGKKN